MNRIEAFYDNAPEYEWHRLERHRIEYEITMRAFSEFLPPAPARIVDIGGGVGRYAIELTRRGYSVTLVDLSQQCLDFARGKAAEANVDLAGVVHADALDLSALPAERFDAALLMGPLYHLLKPGERSTAVAQVARLLRPGGVVAASFISRYAVLHYAASEKPDYLHASCEEWASIQRDGTFMLAEGSKGFIDAYFASVREVPPLMENSFEQACLLAAESVVDSLEAKINASSPELFATWIDTLYPIAKDPSILGSASHLLYVGKKRAAGRSV